ncbi:MAG TPA: histidine kinase [Chitinophagaceae bacterium]|nr:histidine kinase [Chitinophagaceae bacterium]
MTFNALIFSEQRSDRIKRHLLFWGFWYVYISITHAANPGGSPDISYFRNPVFTFTEAFFIVLAQVPVTYAMLYIVLPKFILRKKYILASFAILIIWFFAGILNLFVLMDWLPKTVSLVLPDRLLPQMPRPEGTSFFMAVVATNKGAFTMSASALMLKFIKYWYLKEQRNLQLQKENTEAQLQLLTAQVHPHFLFNTLNNIYSQAQTESPKGSKMIMGLSDLLRYILYEGRKPLVPLDRELQMILEYIDLEKIRYGNKLDLHYLVTDKTKDVYIAPLLLLPFVENCFKHGTSNMLQNPWINLTIEIKDTTLVMKLMNGKSQNNDLVPKKHGIGISNARQRLELLYNDKHELQIREEEDVFIVDLKIELVKIKGPQQVISQTAPDIIYA